MKYLVIVDHRDQAIIFDKESDARRYLEENDLAYKMVEIDDEVDIIES